MDVTDETLRELSDEEYKAAYNPTTTVYVDNVVPPLGLSLTGVYKKVNFNKKDFYEAIQPVTDHYRGVTNQNTPYRPTPPLLDISKKWETDELYSTGEPGRKNTKYLEHIDAVDDLFTLLYSFKELLDKYPKNSDYSTPGLKTTFELLWGEIWAYYVTIPRVTFSWVYHDILHCIINAGGKDYTGGEVPPTISTSLPFGEQKTYDSDGITGGTPVVPRELEGGEVVGGGEVGDGDDDREEPVSPDTLKVVTDDVEKQLELIKRLGKLTPPKFGEKGEDLKEKALKDIAQRISNFEKGLDEYNALNVLFLNLQLQIYTGRSENLNRPLKLNIHRFFSSKFGEPKKLVNEYHFAENSAPYYLGKLILNKPNIKLMQEIKSSGSKYSRLYEAIERWLEPYNFTIKYLFKDSTLKDEQAFIDQSDYKMVTDMIHTFIPVYLSILLPEILSVKLLMNKEDLTWVIYKGIYHHFNNTRIQNDFEEKLVQSRIITKDLDFAKLNPVLIPMIEGPPYPITTS